MRTRIGTRLIAGAGIVIALAVGVMAAVLLRSHRGEMVSQLAQSADQLSETIKRSARDSMLQNHRENLGRQIEAIGQQRGIERLRLFNKEGRIMFSSDPGEVGRTLDKHAEACDACHAVERPLEKPPTSARARIFRSASGDRVLGIVNPIQNEPTCSSAACHAHRPDESVLGVLDVNLSLADADRAMAAGAWRMALLALVAVAGSGLILWWMTRRLVLRPVRALALATRRVADGDLTTAIPDPGRHELGDLARAFNEMTRRLGDARRQLTQADKLASVGRLAAGVAHEINNPLTGVLTYASYLQARAGDTPELREDLDVVVRETKRCRDIVKGLLDFARQTPPRRQPSDLNETARRAVSMVMNQLALNRVALALELEPGLPPVSADANQMQQVLVNLLLNAADAVGGGGTIRMISRSATLPPWGHEAIRKAACPRGCDLLDPDVRIGGLPAIRVTRECRGRAIAVHMDPVYGRSGHLSAEPCEEGEEARYGCPRCGASLGLPQVRCAACGGPAFGVVAGPGDRIEWCARKGCHWARWARREAAGPRPYVELEVQDTGRGIPPEDMAHLFEPFFTTKGRRGTGLGLAVTWGIVESHGGTIQVDSRVGSGTRFTVRLPLAPAEEAARDAAGSMPAVAGAPLGGGGRG